MAETIERAAVFFNDICYSMPRPHRHHDVLWATVQDTFEQSAFHGPQGFATSTGRFVSREEAMVIATCEGQILKQPTFQPNQLFSEDLW